MNGFKQILNVGWVLESRAIRIFVLVHGFV